MHQDIQLYAYPGACSRISIILLEEIAQPYTLNLVNLPAGQHKTEQYLALNEKGKVPLLMVDSVPVTETPAIIRLLAALFPQAKLLPETSSPLQEARLLADLCFCSSTLHPFVTRLCMPQFYAGESQRDKVVSHAAQGMIDMLCLVDDRLSKSAFWYTDHWSAMDVYLFWIYTRLARCDFDLSPFSQLARVVNHTADRPAVQRALQKESALLSAK